MMSLVFSLLLLYRTSCKLAGAAAFAGCVESLVLFGTTCGSSSSSRFSTHCTLAPTGSCGVV